MPFHYLTNIPLDKAVSDYIDTLAKNGLTYKTETVSSKDAAGRVTAKPVYANICAPHYHACAMDGIALSADVTFGATETTPIELLPAQFVFVDTGDPLPEGCDAVVMIENVVDTESGVLLYSSATPFMNVRQIGEDICAGEMLLTSFTEITPAAAGAMLAGGVMNVEVIKPPVVGIIPTGDEIIPPVENPGPGDIIEFNSTIFKSMLEKWGARAKIYPIVKDEPTLIGKALRLALHECDAVILNAGSSAGREDYSAQAIRSAGEVIYHGIAIRPGKPAILGCSKEKPVLGVPGYPVSAIIVLEYIFRPIIDIMMARESSPIEYENAVLSRAFNSSLKYREFVRARLGKVNGRLITVPLEKGAGIVSSFVKADALMEVPQNAEGYEAGDTVRVRLLRPIDEIERTLLITGSHDPLIDELAELMKREGKNAVVASSHVGSMGGIFAIKRGEAHMAGVHLLDEATGGYNKAYVEKHFPSGGVSLVECVYRVQGLMVKKGNPLNIKGLSDLSSLSYVNRQKGSGTRILLDYLLKKEGINASEVYGYEREEFTHTSVAALIASGSADAGLGIYSAASIYDLDFIPICKEQYDFLVADEALKLTSVKQWLRTLQSEAFHKRAMQMGGYELVNPGIVRE